MCFWNQYLFQFKIQNSKLNSEIVVWTVIEDSGWTCYFALGVKIKKWIHKGHREHRNVKYHFFIRDLLFDLLVFGQLHLGSRPPKSPKALLSSVAGTRETCQATWNESLNWSQKVQQVDDCSCTSKTRWLSKWGNGFIMDLMTNLLNCRSNVGKTFCHKSNKTATKRLSLCPGCRNFYYLLLLTLW